MKTQNGFSLVELMIVVVVMGILMAIALPNYSDYVIRGKIPDATSALSTKRVQMNSISRITAAMLPDLPATRIRPPASISIFHAPSPALPPTSRCRRWASLPWRALPIDLTRAATNQRPSPHRHPQDGWRRRRQRRPPPGVAGLPTRGARAKHETSSAWHEPDRAGGLARDHWVTARPGGAQLHRVDSKHQDPHHCRSHAERPADGAHRSGQAQYADPLLSHGLADGYLCGVGQRHQLGSEFR